MEELNYGIEYDKVNSNNYRIWHLTETEFMNLYECGIFEDINKECEVFIDDFEIEWIEFNSLYKTQNIFDKHNSKVNEIVKLKEFISLATTKKTGIEFAF